MRPKKGLKDEILLQGLRQLTAVGAKALSLRAVTAAAGVTPMAAYRHFKNREALVAALAAEGLRAFAKRLHDASRRGVPRKRLFDMCRAYLAFSRESPVYFRLIFGTEVRNRRDFPDLYAAGGEAFKVLTGIVVDCQEAEVIDARLDTVECAANLWVHIHGYSTLRDHWLTSDRVPTSPDADGMADSFMAALLDGLGGARRR